jgi:hypothetical protein
MVTRSADSLRCEMHWAVRELARVMEPPESGDQVNWKKVSEESGIVFPADYRNFVALYGGGEMDGLLGISTPPVGESFYGDLLEMSVLPPADEYYPYPYPPYPKPGGLLPWGSTSLGDDVFWLCEGDDPDAWVTVVHKRHAHHREDPWKRFDGRMAEFLLALIRGEFPNPFSQSGFPDPHPKYVGWREQ